MFYFISCGHQILKYASASEPESGTDCHREKSGETAKVMCV